MSHKSRASVLGSITPLLLFLGALGFYLLTLAPTVLWGDDAWLQRAALGGRAELTSPIRLTWLMLARLFVRLPVGDVAVRSNMLSAVAASAAVMLVYLGSRSLQVSRVGSVLAAIGLAVAHTFWMHAVRAEVYTLFAALVLLELWLWWLWAPGRTWPMRLAPALWAVLLLTHPMAVLLLPAWAWLLWRRRAWVSPKELGWWLLSFAAGVVLFLGALRTIGAGPADALLYLTKSGEDDRGALFAFSLAKFPRDTFLWLGMLGLQFVGPALLLIVAGLLGNKAWRGDARWHVLLVFYLTSVVFAFAYRVNDQFVFYLPSYLALVFFIGLGWDTLVPRWRQLAHPASGAGVGVLAAISPPLAYFLAVQVVLLLGINPFGVRSLAGREPVSFFLWPGKAGYNGARAYGEAALSGLPANALLVADHTPLNTLLYLQQVEGLRPDVRLAFAGPGVDLNGVLAGRAPGTPVYFADNNPAYYAFPTLADSRLAQEGVVFRLISPP